MKKSMPALVLTAALCTATTCLAATSWTGATNNDYNTPGNWNNGVPGTGNNGTIGVANNNPVTVSANTSGRPAIYIANAVGQTASLTVNNVSFGNKPDNTTRLAELGLAGAGGTATFTQTGAAALTASDYVFIGRNSGTSIATMNVYGGEVYSPSWIVGGSGAGTLNLANATLTIRNQGAAGTVNRLDIGGGLYSSGTTPQGTVNLGDATNPGTITFSRQTVNQGISVVVRTVAGASGTLRGWGSVTTAVAQSNNSHGTLTNNGRVLADGYGTDRDLNLTGVAGGILNTFENTSNNGWFAVNKGRLVLPTLAVSAGDSSFNWGEAASDTSIDLVNSARLAFTGATAGSITGMLYAADCAAVPAGLDKPMAIWSFAGVTSTAAAVTFRYDDAAAAAIGLPESKLAILRHAGTSWSDVTGEVDSVTKTITSQVIGTWPANTTFFAVLEMPPKATAIIIR